MFSFPVLFYCTLSKLRQVEKREDQNFLYFITSISKLQQLPNFAKGVDRDRNEILAWIKHRVTSAKLEAFNATISRIVKRACGYRDLDYLYLKIRQEASPPPQL